MSRAQTSLQSPSFSQAVVGHVVLVRHLRARHRNTTRARALHYVRAGISNFGLLRCYSLSTPSPCPARFSDVLALSACRTLCVSRVCHDCRPISEGALVGNLGDQSRRLASPVGYLLVWGFRLSSVIQCSGPFNIKRCYPPKAARNQISRREGEMMAVAGLWEAIRWPAGKITCSYCIITSEPNSLIAPIQDAGRAGKGRLASVAWGTARRSDVAAASAAGRRLGMSARW